MIRNKKITKLTKYRLYIHSLNFTMNTYIPLIYVYIWEILYAFVFLT